MIRSIVSFWILFAFGSGCAVTPGKAPAPKRVLLTAFEPFGGRNSNNSWDVASFAAADASLKEAGIEVALCKLPVVYDQGAQAAIGCFEKLDPPPAVVLSLGEAGCKMKLETAAHNLDDTPNFKDNAGGERVKKPILVDAPKTIAFDLPMPDLYCALDAKTKQEIVVSESPGGFVCNNEAYHLARYFAGKGPRFGFVHVPNSGCPAEKRDPVRHGANVARMIEAAVGRGRMPFTSDAVDCRIDFLKRLRERLSASSK